MLFFCFLLQCFAGDGQEQVQCRLVMIGDAGELNSIQQRIIGDARSRSIPGRTIAVFLGDNVYPKGIELTDEKKQKSMAILRAQFEQFRKNHIPVYFVPGNHDWDKSGPMGFEKMQAVNVFINEQHDSLLKVIPANACPGPYAVPVNDNIVIIAMDSEWWLYPYDTHAASLGCSCRTKDQVLTRLSALLDSNRNKLVIFATHHPFNSYGSHGGYYSLKEHLFPLTDLNKYLYLPLPLIGSLYPLYRKAFPPREDLENALYRDMRARVGSVLKMHPNIIHASGHEHTLQLIQDSMLQLVSGAGCKFTPVKKGKGSVFAAAASGYVIADILQNNSVRLEFFSVSKKNIQSVFVYLKPFATVLPLR